MPKPPIEVKVGQRWRDNDSRSVYPDFVVVAVDEDRQHAWIERSNHKRHRVKLRRLGVDQGSHGYRLVEDV